MNRISPFILLCLALPCSAQISQSAPQKRNWKDDILSAKPYSLEVCYGETDAPFPKGVLSFMSSPAPIPTQQFLEQSKKITVAISETDQGSIAVNDGSEVLFKIQREKEAFEVQISLRVLVAGNRIMTTKLSIPENEWVVVGEGKRESGGSAHYSYTVVRIRKRE